MRILRTATLLSVVALLAPTAMVGQSGPPAEPPAEWGPIGINLENVPYPAPVHFMEFSLYGVDVRMAYMDVHPTGASNGKTVLLMHGSNFFGEYFYNTIEALSDAGFRVVVPDRIGWGKSSKPIIPYSISRMAANAAKLLDHLGVESAAIVGHSMGGVVASRFALNFPDKTTHLALVNSIGLTDPRIGRGLRDFERSYENTLNRTYASIVRGQQRYYRTPWKPAYERYIRIHYGWLLSGDWPHMARIRALIGESNFKEPVVYDWQHIQAKTLVTGGADDGPNFAARAKAAAEAFPNGRLELIPGIGHNPHLVVPDKLHAILIPFLEETP